MGVGGGGRYCRYAGSPGPMTNRPATATAARTVARPAPYPPSINQE